MYTIEELEEIVNSIQYLYNKKISSENQKKLRKSIFLKTSEELKIRKKNGEIIKGIWSKN